MKEGQVESRQGASLHASRHASHHASHYASRHTCLKMNWTFVGSRMEKAAMQSYIC